MCFPHNLSATLGHEEFARRVFIVTDKARELGGIYKEGGWCGERLRAKAGGDESLALLVKYFRTLLGPLA